MGATTGVMLPPLIFEPIFKERIWGGRRLEVLYGKKLPRGVPIGESWEISDRPGESNLVASGPLAGRSLTWLMENHARDLLGDVRLPGKRFPLLVKILDAREILSVQVHPPAKTAAELNSESKTEMWYVAEADPGAELFAGLRRDVTKEKFERHIRDGTLAESLHRIPVRRGDALFLPSGRIHALGAGVVVFEIQQNSDTTYRVFDWNRTGLDGKPRALHVPESLMSIDFTDFEPSLVQAAPVHTGPAVMRTLVDNALFTVRHCQLRKGSSMTLPPATMHIIGVLSGVARVSANHSTVFLGAGGFTVLPACLDQTAMSGEGDLEFLLIEAGGNKPECPRRE